MESEAAIGRVPPAKGCSSWTAWRATATCRKMLFRVGTQSLAGQGEGKFAVFALEEPSTSDSSKVLILALTAGC